MHTDLAHIFVCFSLLRESNEKLLNSAFDMERERKYMVWNQNNEKMIIILFKATENALKVQISQLAHFSAGHIVCRCLGRSQLPDPHCHGDNYPFLKG